MQRPIGSTIEDRLRLIEEERAVQDVLTRYTHFYDGGDVDGVMSVFHPECTLINPRGTYVGADAIRRNYTFLISLSKIVLHLAPNVIVRVSEGAEHAWMTAYYYSIAADKEGMLIGTGGTYADELVKVDGSWRIIRRRITYNFRHTLVRAPAGEALPPPPTSKESSRDIVGPDWEM